VLAIKIETRTYENTLLNQTNFDQTVSEEICNQAKLAVKDEYTFDFLDLAEEHSERELERALIAKVEVFLREMGGMFTFAGSQYRLELDGEEYFIDLLLYHRALKCLVAVELKVGKFLPEYVGKMQFYLALLDDKTRLEGENPSIGIILCKDKKKTTVEYALRESNKPIGVATYRILEKLPTELQGSLPSPEQICRLLEGL
jgi:predicted nuclease of restriction endonuclease-like (RecB) superfamily